MNKTLTLRLSKEDYEKIAKNAKQDHRPISNFIIHVVLDKIDEDFYCDDEEMNDINSDKSLMEEFKKAEKDAKRMKGTFVK